jgi:hypothetical protein
MERGRINTRNIKVNDIMTRVDLKAIDTDEITFSIDSKATTSGFGSFCGSKKSVIGNWRRNIAMGFT